MEQFGQYISKKMNQALSQLTEKYQYTLIPTDKLDRVYDFLLDRIAQKQKQAVDQLERNIGANRDPAAVVEHFFGSIAQKQQDSVEEFFGKLEGEGRAGAANGQAYFRADQVYVVQNRVPQSYEDYNQENGYNEQNNQFYGQDYNNNMAYQQNNQYTYSTPHQQPTNQYNNQYNNHQQQQLQKIIAYEQSSMPNRNNRNNNNNGIYLNDLNYGIMNEIDNINYVNHAVNGAVNDMVNMGYNNNNNNNQFLAQIADAQDQIIRQTQYDYPHKKKNQPLTNSNNLNNLHNEQDNPQTIYRKQFKTRQQQKNTHTKKNSQKFISEQDQQQQRDSKGNKFSAYKKQLEYLEENSMGGTSPLNGYHNQTQHHHKQKQKSNQLINSPNSVNLNTSSQRLALIGTSQLIRKNSEKKLYKISKQSIRKHSLKKQKQAQSQMIANIQFLKSIRGSNLMHSPKNQWKQQTKNIKDTIQSIKEAKRKNMEVLGFGSGSSGIGGAGDTNAKTLLHSKMILSDISSPHRADLLPQIKKSRKKALIHKPAPFSVYTLQKDHEIFYNKTTK